MALKDLVADHGKMTEQAIEDVVADFVRFDAKAGRIVFTPEVKSLTSEQLILLYLVAIEGWQYIPDASFEISTTPANIGQVLGIAGGTVRPAIKKLRELHLISNVDGQYKIQMANLDTVSDIVAGKAKLSKPKRSASKSRKATGKVQKQPVSKKAKSSSNSLGSKLEQWIGEGFFAEPRSLADLLARYHEVGVITKSSSLSGLLLQAVRNQKLRRCKVERDGKQVWAYEKPIGQ